MPTRVAVLDDYQAVAESYADWGGLPDTEVRFFHDHLDDEDALVDRLVGFDVLVLMRERTPLRRSLLARLPKLRLAVTTGMRNASIDLEAAREYGVVVCGTQGSAAATTELAWALILSLVRHIPAEDAAIRAGGWQHTVGTDLAGATLGLLGLGRLGRAMVPVARAFGMDVIAWSQNLTDQAAAEAGATRVDKDELFARSDVLSIHLVLSDRTRGLVGARELALMKPTAYLVNTSRGPIVDEQALLTALREGRIAGAGLDVFDREPLPTDHPLRQAPRTVLTPHIGFVTHRTYAQWYVGAVEAIAAFLAGRPINVLNPAPRPSS
ncbi:D-2-hydroxyacid dehydrogenase family protein [Thermasporomyces composti]|uniref:Lactate dehydrogenase-like 2-hydroxyacid dehydrogenase n=1 Tax=Thermasporomyces composti TaxID=696763 RepID=A0A3D9V2N8_THECX|nr:D-2-hydroxyacid dehydrogenase family protein [Thermasporomyces composti]REF35988.1 lactate dehydrogenase-like 2-hydroxyacid dehydrogenase [Thermasporomyces composti]